MILEAESYGGAKLPPRSERCYGQPREGDKIGFFIDPRTGKLSEVPFREIVRATSMGGGASGGDDGDEAPRAPRPPISRKGVERIGDLRTDALHQGLYEAEIDDTALLGLRCWRWPARTSLSRARPGEQARRPGAVPMRAAASLAG